MKHDSPACTSSPLPPSPSTRANLRREHLVERRALQDRLVAADQEREVLRHVAERRVQAAVRHRDAGIEVEALLLAPSSVAA